MPTMAPTSTASTGAALPFSVSAATGVVAKDVLERLTRELGKEIDEVPSQVMRLLEAYEWPGNIRELENVLHRAVILSPGRTLELGTIQIPVATTSDTVSTALVDVERRHIRNVLDTSRWRIEGVGGAAQVLGMKPSTLRSRLLKLRISRPQ